MKRDHTKEITLVMCEGEDCHQLILEDDSWEINGLSYCWHCIAEYLCLVG